MANITVDRLSLQLSGLSDRDGRRLALLVTDALAAANIDEKARYMVGAMRINADAQPGQSVDELSKSIVTEVLRQIQRR